MNLLTLDILSNNLPPSLAQTVEKVASTHALYIPLYLECLAQKPLILCVATTQARKTMQELMVCKIVYCIYSLRGKFGVR